MSQYFNRDIIPMIYLYTRTSNFFRDTITINFEHDFRCSPIISRNFQITRLIQFSKNSALT